ncbi:hypothetical protein [Paracoccus sanguinis]|uniref:hypothetical protein n=1 Tax=Paracoccus sanguinis TaxID=1545044 RepID=UPI00051FC50C|nr:hypothetical protein [Paracoccus sanguinis]KGJ14922.1 lipoprotein [Paracoccus sanguinis]
MACCAALAACADKSDQIGASYVSPGMYANLSCPQLAEEAQTVANRAAQASAAQDKKANDDAVAVGVATVLFWPALFMIKGDGAGAAEVARLKGEMQAIEQANARKRCNIRFRR